MLSTLSGPDSEVTKQTHTQNTETQEKDEKTNLYRNCRFIIADIVRLLAKLSP